MESTKTAEAGANLAGVQVTTQRSVLRELVTNNQTALLVVWIGMVAIFTYFEPKFLSSAVFTNVLMDWGPIVLLALGQLFVVVSGGIDLSVGAAAGFTGIVGGYAMQKLTTDGTTAYPTLLAGLVVCMLMGAVVGGVNSFLIHVNKLVPFIATLVTMAWCYGLTAVFTTGAPVAGGPTLEALQLQNPVIGPFSIPVLIVAVICLLGWLLLHQTRFGRYTYAIGSNSFAARTAGINVPRHLTKVYVLSGVLAGMAGYFYYLRLGSAGPSSGRGMELTAIAAIVIGGAALAGGVGKVLGTVLGALILATVTSGMIMTNVDPDWNQIVIGAFIAVAATLQVTGRANGGKS